MKLMSRLLIILALAFGPALSWCGAPAAADVRSHCDTTPACCCKDDCGCTIQSSDTTPTTPSPQARTPDVRLELAPMTLAAPAAPQVAAVRTPGAVWSGPALSTPSIQPLICIWLS